MEACIDAVERLFLQWADGRAANRPRSRAAVAGAMLHVLPAASEPLGRMAAKVYATTKGGARFVVLLFDARSAELLAILEADRLGHMRTGAASGVATRLLARRDARVLCVLGTGWQARSQVEAICAVRPIKTAVAFSRNPERRAAFCSEMSEKLSLGVYPAAAPEEAIRDSDIIVTATTAKEPVLRGEWLAAGTHVNAVGSNFLVRQEIDVETVRRSACVVVDSVEQARLESGDLVRAAEADAFYWEDAHELGEVVTGEFPGREDDSEITLFESHGIALEDVALAARVYRAALDAGLRTKTPF